MLGSATGTDKINLPSDFSEIIAEISYSGNYYTFNVSKAQLSETYKRFMNGYKTDGNYYSSASIYVNLSDICCYSYHVDGEKVVSKAKLNVWYR